jgi:hypothetical protein
MSGYDVDKKKILLGEDNPDDCPPGTQEEPNHE